MEDKIYFCIDMKSFFASVECAERGLNPFETNLVVADESRGKGAICLAISPAMKSLGVRNRCRLFEIPENVKYIVAKPRMKKYIEYTADIYAIYLKYLSKEDIHVYSIDESFIDVTQYLKIYNLTPKRFAVKLIDEIAKTKGIPATCGIGTNMYLAKIALDITAKKVPDHIGFLNEELYRETLWEHTPLSDFWQISAGTVKRLKKYGVITMKGVTELSEKLLYKEFGINAELLIDHAYGKESCTMADIKAYKSKSKSVSFSQILFEDYPFDKAKLVFEEMIQNACYEMMSRNLIAKSGGFFIGYSKDIYPSDGETVKLLDSTNLFSLILPQMLGCFEKYSQRGYLIRRLGVTFNVADKSCEGYDLFVDYDKIQKEKNSELAVLQIKKKYGKNAMLKGIDYQDGATMKIRNKLIGGHNGE